jgi:hypothetical protein
MEYFTILWVTILGGPLDGSTSGIVYSSLAQCEKATTVVSATLDYDHSLACDESLLVSMSTHPKPRPEGLADG